MIKTNEVTITPDMASEWTLRHAERMAAGEFKQRGMSAAVINKYACDMKAGNWELCPQPIVFDEANNLLDGQHRLEAVKKAGVPVKMLVSTGWPSGGKNGSLKASTIDTIDRGRPRGIANQLQVHGVPNATMTAATVNAIVRCHYRGKNMPISYAATVQILEKLGVRDQLEALHNLGSTQKAKGRLYGPLCLYRMAKPRKADEFARQYLAMDFEKGSGPHLLARYESNRNAKEATQEGYIMVACGALRVWDEDAIQQYIQPSAATLEWLIGLNPKLADNIRALVKA